jgi:hypothetical protein
MVIRISVKHAREMVIRISVKHAREMVIRGMGLPVVRHTRARLLC